MRTRLLYLILPLVTAATIVGTGFGVFHFYEGRESTSFTVSGRNVELEVMAATGSATIENSYLPSLVFSYYSIDFSDALSIGYTGGDNWGERTFSMDLAVTLSFSEGGRIASYVRVDDWEYDPDTATYSTLLEGVLEAGDSEYVEYIFTGWPSLSYRSGMRPTSSSDLESLIQDVDGESVEMTFTLSMGGEVSAND